MLVPDLLNIIQRKKSFLCVGLDTDPTKIPYAFKRYKNPVLAFNKAVINATKEYAAAYKVNTAFYEAQGVEGWRTLAQTLDAIPAELFTIADAKRGDIGNTAAQYAKAFFETMPFDACTVNPYMGIDTLEPFWKYDDHTTIVLGLTSNPGAQDFEKADLKTKGSLFEKVMLDVANAGNKEQTMFVVGATQQKELQAVRQLLPEHAFLVPGVGTQGGTVKAVYNHAATKDVGLLVNVSRGIMYAGNEHAAPEEQIALAASTYQKEMAELMRNVS